MAGPLSGVKVIDISTAYAGPYCSMFLADMGAEVIKVERPGTGDDSRGWGPPFAGPESAWFLSTNRNKKSITLNIAAEAGRDVLRQLVRTADVFLENLKPSTLDRIGLDYAALRPLNPRLIYCAISGFGMDGPYRDRPGYDLIAQALGGIMSVTGEKGGQPQKVGTSLSDITAGMVAAFAIASALFGRQQTGQGEFIDISLLDGQVGIMAPRIASYLVSGIEPRPAGSTDSPITIYQPVPTADRPIAVATGNESLWQRFCQAAELAELLDDPRFRTNRDRTTHKADLIPVIEARLRQRPAAEWLERLHAAGVPCAPIQYLGEVVSHPQVQARGMIRELDHPTAGKVKLVAPPWRLGSGEAPMAPPPLLGQHTAEVLGQHLGYGEEELARLRESQVI